MNNDLLASTASSPVSEWSYAEHKRRFSTLLADNNAVVSRRSTNRKVRELDPELLELPTQASSDDTGKLDSPDVMIPVHLVQKLIMRRYPDLYNFLTAPSRVASFVHQTIDFSSIEKAFTELYRYQGWKVPLMLAIDGALTHGWAGVELVFSKANQAGCAFNYVGYGDVLFPTDARDLDSCEIIYLRKNFTVVDFKELALLDGANVAEIQKIIKKFDNSAAPKDVYRAYTKLDGIVYSYYCSEESNDFLTYPAPYYAGEVGYETSVEVNAVGLPMPVEQRVPLSETSYPVYLFTPFQTEQATINSSRGQAFWSRPVQKALSSMASGVVSRAVAAAGVYGSVDVANVPAGTRPEQLGPIKRNGLYSVPVKFTSPDGPKGDSVQIMQYFDTVQSDEAGQTAYTVTNRQDARKTAAELSQAVEQQQLNKSPLIDSFAEFQLKTILAVWRIAISRRREPNSPLANAPIETPYIRPAGYPDVVERQQLLARLERYHPLAVASGIALPYTARIMQLAFPDEPFAEMIQQEAATQRYLAACYELLKATTTPQELAALPPDKQQQFIEITNAIQQHLAGPTGQLAGQPNNAPVPSSPPSGEGQIA